MVKYKVEAYLSDFKTEDLVAEILKRTTNQDSMLDKMKLEFILENFNNKTIEELEQFFKK